MLAYASPAIATEETAHAAPEVPISPSALKAPAVLPARAMIGSLSSRVSAKASFTSPMCALIAAYRSASPVTTKLAEDEQLALALAEASHEAWQSAAPSQLIMPVQDGGLTAAPHSPWHS